MGYEIPPGAMPGFIITPEAYMRFMHQRGPNIWPVYFGARMAAHAIQDFAMKVIQWHSISEMKKNIPLMLYSGLDVARDQATSGPTGDADALKEDLERIYTGLNDNWAAGVFEGMGGAYSQYMDGFLRTGQLFYAYKTLAYHTGITPRMRRHWNQQFTPMELDASMAWVLYRRKEVTSSQFETHASWDGWSKENADLLRKGMLNLPSPREAFYLWVKGLITETKRNDLYFAGGFNEEWHPAMTDNYFYTPTIYDLTRIADYVELDQIWASAQMRRRGVKDADIARIWQMLKIRPLRDEVRSITAKSVYAREHGYWSHDYLDTELGDLEADGYIRSTEKELLGDLGDLLYEIELKEEWIDILRWRFRTAVISEADFLEGLIDPDGPVAMLEEKANLIVEAEKARGYYGYY